MYIGRGVSSVGIEYRELRGEGMKVVKKLVIWEL